MGDDLQQALIKSATHGRSAFGSAFRNATTHWGYFPYHNPVDTPARPSCPKRVRNITKSRRGHSFP